MYYGGDYNPEQWPEDVWEDDVRLMNEAGVNLVSLGIFSWSRIQPSEGEFDFAWLDRVIDTLHRGGIQVNLATATASPPPWASTNYPAMLPQLADGTVLWHGSRQAYAPTSLDYRRLAGNLVSAIAQRYAAHPAVVMWHINNEYGCHLHYDYSDNAAVAFRLWLRHRYRTVDVLNEAWGTVFWSQRYGTFDEVIPPRTAPYSLNPSSVLDFRRFTSDALRELYRMERDIIRAAGATQPITTNFMGAFEPIDYWSWADDLDLVADDSYPDPADPESFRQSAFTRDLMRAIKPGVPWVLMEQATDAVNWRDSNSPKAPGQMASLSMQAIARGADGVMFFQWRQSTSGSEKFHSAMLPHSGTDTDTWRDVAKLGATLTALPNLGASSQASVALVYDWANRWAINNPDHPVQFNYLDIVQRWYNALHRHNVMVDIVPPGRDLSGYSVVVAPQLYLLTDVAAAELIRFADSGGWLLVSAFSDVVDGNDHFRPNGFTTQLARTLGVSVTDFGALPLAAVCDVNGEMGPFAGQYFAERLRIGDATTIATFTSGGSVGAPAVTRSVGGRSYYVATIPDDDGMLRLIRCLLDGAGVRSLLGSVPPRIEVIERNRRVFIINHDRDVATVLIPSTWTLLQASDDSPTIPAFGWRIYNTETA